MSVHNISLFLPDLKSAKSSYFFACTNQMLFILYQGSKINKVTIQTDSFDRFTNLDTICVPWRYDGILRQGEIGAVMLTVPAALFKYNIVSENDFSDGRWRCNLKNIDSCHSLGTEEMGKYHR